MPSDVPSDELHCEDTGAGPPAMLLHSSGMSGRQWRRLAVALTQVGRRAIVPNLASGHGRSPAWPAPRPFSFQVDVARLLALLARFEEPVDLIGHSYGGFLALLTARAAPSRIRSLALYDPVAFGTLDPGDSASRRDLERVPSNYDGSEEGRDAYLEAFVDYWGGAGAWPSLREEARAEFRRVAWVLSQGVSTLGRDDTPASEYRVIEAPVLLLGGEKTPAAARKVVQHLSEALRRSRAVTVAGAGHMGPLTHGDVVNEAILSWVTTGS